MMSGGETPNFRRMISLLSFSRHDGGEQIAVIDGGGYDDEDDESDRDDDDGENHGGRSLSGVMGARRKTDVASSSLSMWEWRHGIECGSTRVHAPLNPTCVVFVPSSWSSSLSLSSSTAAAAAAAAAARKKSRCGGGGEMVLGGGKGGRRGGGGEATVTSWKMQDGDCVLVKDGEGIADGQAKGKTITGLTVNNTCK